jgi:hypothetical protein
VENELIICQFSRSTLPIRFSDEQLAVDSVEIPPIKEALDGILCICLDQVLSVEEFSCAVGPKTVVVFLLANFAGECLVDIFEPRSEL